MNFGILNEHAVGTLMRDTVWRVIQEIRRQRFSFEASAKEGYSGQLNDLVTTADRAAQEIYVKRLKELFPTFGIISEEDGLFVKAQNEMGAYFTVDPLDGTKAFARRQSHGIGTMLALVAKEEVVAVVIGDIMTQELYYYRPDSNAVHRLSEFHIDQRLVIDENRKLAEQNLLLRELPSHYSSAAATLLINFNGVNVADGSIGITMARLWKGEVGGVLLQQQYRTPWDETPVLGISRKLGFVHLRVGRQLGGLFLFEPTLCTAPVYDEQEILVVHHSRLSELGVS